MIFSVNQCVFPRNETKKRGNIPYLLSFFQPIRHIIWLTVRLAIRHIDTSNFYVPQLNTKENTTTTIQIEVITCTIMTLVRIVRRAFLNVTFSCSYKWTHTYALTTRIMSIRFHIKVSKRKIAPNTQLARISCVFLLPIIEIQFSFFYIRFVFFLSRMELMLLLLLL